VASLTFAEGRVREMKSVTLIACRTSISLSVTA
jgi:hypothetical protein